MKRDSFVFYTSWLKGIESLSEENQAAIVFALIRYAAYGEEPKTNNPVVKMAFAYAKPQIDANNKRYLASKKGGAPKGNHNNPKGRGASNHRLDNNQPNEYEDDDVDGNEDEYVYKNVKNGEEINEEYNEDDEDEDEDEDDDDETCELCPPTNIEEIRRFIELNHLPLDPWKVLNYFESTGWRIDGIPIVDWRLAILNLSDQV